MKRLVGPRACTRFEHLVCALFGSDAPPPEHPNTRMGHLWRAIVGDDQSPPKLFRHGKVTLEELARWSVGEEDGGRLDVLCELCVDPDRVHYEVSHGGYPYHKVYLPVLFWDLIVGLDEDVAGPRRVALTDFEGQAAVVNTFCQTPWIRDLAYVQDGYLYLSVSPDHPDFKAAAEIATKLLVSRMWADTPRRMLAETDGQM